MALALEVVGTAPPLPPAACPSPTTTAHLVAHHLARTGRRPPRTRRSKPLTLTKAAHLSASNTLGLDRAGPQAHLGWAVAVAEGEGAMASQLAHLLNSRVPVAYPVTPCPLNSRSFSATAKW